MNGVEKKVLKIGLGGIAAALLMAGGQANAAPACGTTLSIATVLAPGFTCTLGDSTFSAFSATGVPSSAVVEFFAPNSTQSAVTLGRDGGMLQTLTFNFMVTETSPHVINEASVGIDVATATPATSTVTTFNGLPTAPATLSNSNTGFTMIPGASSVAADNSVTIPGGAFVSSLTDFFSETQEHGVPEPASLSLFGLGLLGLGFARRRRS